MLGSAEVMGKSLALLAPHLAAAGATSAEMETCVRALHAKGLAVPVLLGGAALSPALAQRISVVDGTPDPGGVFYGQDAFSGLEICREIASSACPKAT